MANELSRSHIYHPEMPTLLARGLPTYFLNFVKFNFDIFASHYKCEITISARRTLEAFDGWNRDTERTLSEMNSHHGSQGLDHYKQAGFLAYWLRRRDVLEEITAMQNPIPGIARDYISPLQETFIDFGNEIGSFLFGFHYCLRYEYGRRISDLRACQLPEDYILAMAVMLKQKNVSPHALYLVYKSLFLDIQTKNAAD